MTVTIRLLLFACLFMPIAVVADCSTAASDLRRSMLLDSGSQEEERLLRSVISSCPGMAEAHFNLGNNLLRQKNFQAAITSFEQATSIKQDAGFYVGLASARAQHGDLDGAEEAFQKALSLKPEHIAALQGMAYVHEKHGETEKAEALLTKSVQLLPNDALSWFNLGVVRERLGNNSGAKEAYQVALKKRTGFAAAAAKLARIQIKEGNLAAARTLLERAEVYGQDSLDVLLAKSELRQGEENLVAARELLVQGEQKWPNSKELKSQLGVTLVRLGEFEAGIEKLKEVVAQIPKSSEGRAALGWAYLKQKALSQAETELTTAIELNEKNARAVYNLGLVYELKGDEERAKQYFNKAEQLGVSS